MLDVEKLALEAGCDKLEHLTKGDREFLDRFADLVLEAAAVQCEDEHVGQGVNDDCENNGDRAYNLALRHAAAAIRAMKQGESNE
jgi:hypothetical protein